MTIADVTKTHVAEASDEALLLSPLFPFSHSIWMWVEERKKRRERERENETPIFTEEPISMIT